MSGLPSSSPIYAIVTLKTSSEVQGGAAPVFYVKSEKEQEHIAMWLARIASVAVHDLHDGTWVLIPI